MQALRFMAKSTKLFFFIILSVAIIACGSFPVNPQISTTKTPITITSPTITVNEFPALQNTPTTIASLYKNNGGCELPCWWGITPGKSVWQDTKNFLLTLGVDIGKQYGTSRIARYDVYFGIVPDATVENIYPGIWIQNGVVKAIGINSSWVSRDFGYSLSELLIRFGIPEEIWVNPVTDVGDDKPFYYMVLMYPSKGILVDFTGIIEKNEDHLSVCPQNIFSHSPYPPAILLWNSIEQAPFEKFGEEILDDDLGWITNEYRLLQDISPNKLSNSEFHKLYSNATQEECLSIISTR